MEGVLPSAVSKYHSESLDSNAAELLGLVLHVSQPEEQLQDEKMEEEEEEEEEEASDGEWEGGGKGGGDEEMGEGGDSEGDGGSEGSEQHSFSRELIAFSLYGKIPTKSSKSHSHVVHASSASPIWTVV